MKKHRIRFPKENTKDTGQDETVFELIENDQNIELRFHDYTEIYNREGLYEQLFYDRLKCVSPTVVAKILKTSVDSTGQRFTKMRVLDLGAGNGMMGEVLKTYGVARLIGADIIAAAKEACARDRPHLYDDYYVTDFTNLKPEEKEDFEEWSFDCLTSVAALSFGDIPPKAFFQGIQFVRTGGWIAFNIKETFMEHSDTTGFSKFIRELIFSEYFDLYQLVKYKHRLSMEGEPIYYYAVVAQKTDTVPDDFLEVHGVKG
ncbi:MAG TPA: methyltransferase domain-containing protein [Flavobacteriaceae bacterium]|nr:methyltransferase domain-containing protein [Flavobacteriaceae bacterium]